MQYGNMDNSPRSGYPAANLAGSDVCFIDLSCQQALSAYCLSMMAGKLGKTSDEDEFASEHAELNRLVNNYHWCGRKGFYYDVFGRHSPDVRHNFLGAKTAAAFWPILSGTAAQEQINALLEHLLSPDEFWTRHPVPSLSKDDPNYDPMGGYWLGGVWAPTNYMIAAGLKKRGWNSVSRDLAAKHLDGMAEVMKDKSYGSIWECYSPDHSRPSNKYEKGELVRNNFVGWSGLGPIAMLIENILAFSFDAPSNTIHWEIADPGVHGLRKLLFNGRTVSLICGRSASPGRREIHIETSKPVIVSITMAGREGELTNTMKAGKQELHI
ncbi:MAG: trehalase family glycosidase [Victivallales bacterium]|jgi:glycogen debranching enzyme